MWWNIITELERILTILSNLTQIKTICWIYAWINVEIIELILQSSSIQITSSELAGFTKINGICFAFFECNSNHNITTVWTLESIDWDNVRAIWRIQKFELIMNKKGREEETYVEDMQNWFHYKNIDCHNIQHRIFVFPRLQTANDYVLLSDMLNHKSGSNSVAE